MSDSSAHLTLLYALLVAFAASALGVVLARRALCPLQRYRPAWLLAAGACISLGTLMMHALGNTPMQPGDMHAALMGCMLGIGLNAASLRLLDSRLQLPAGELLAGVGIATGILCIHYAALGALRLSAPQQLQGQWSVLSLALALSLCCLAMITARRLSVGRGQLLCTLLLSAAIVLTAYSTQYSLAALPWPAQDSGQGSISLLLVSCLLALLVAAVNIAANTRLRRRSNRLHLQLGRASEQVSQLHRHDRLTGLPNRTLLREQLESYLRPARGERPGLALYLIDLVGFNQINALHGHATGDGVLKRVASRLRSTLPSPLMLARLGSDEFVLVQPASSPEQASVTAEQLRTQLAQPIHIHGRVLQINTHIGIALSPNDGDTAQRLMSNADAALGHARRQQVPGYSFHQQARPADATDSQHLLSDLHHAQALGQLRLHYQPKFPSCGYPVVGVEALLRWQHPEHGLIAPDNFIPLAERSGLILPIGNWVLDQACHQLQQWRQAGNPEWTMSVNLSPLQFTGNDLVTVVRDVLLRHGIPPRLLILEVTETSALGDMQASISMLNQISALGVRISIDDFGTGYSTLLYLKQLPATELKIDRAFVQNLQPGSDDANIIAAIIELGRTLQMRTVAEGVETLEQQQQLQAMGCDLVQGFHLARPLPVDDFEQRYCCGLETA